MHRRRHAIFAEVTCRYFVRLEKHGGALGRVSYANNDFDVLLVALMDSGHLCGTFIFPIHVLEQKGLVGQKAMTLILHPPWSLPKMQATKMRYAWQLDFFVDLHSWTGEPPLPRNSSNCLEALLQPLIPTVTQCSVPRVRNQGLLAWIVTLGLPLNQ